MAETADRHEKMLGGKCEAEWVSLFYYGLEAGTKMMLGAPIGWALYFCSALARDKLERERCSSKSRRCDTQHRCLRKSR